MNCFYKHMNSSHVQGCYAGTVYIISARTGEIVWSYTTRGPVKSSPCVDQSTGLVYVSSHDNNIYCLNIQVFQNYYSHFSVDFHIIFVKQSS